MKSLHPNNIHKRGYDFEFLMKNNKNLIPFIVEKFEKLTIDFSNPKAVKFLNKALLNSYYGIPNWEFSDKNLCPPIPGRVDYIHYLADLIKGENKVSVLDVGTGATCIYPILGSVIYNWNFVASDINKHSLKIAQDNIDNNNLGDKIKLRYQEDVSKILTGIIKSGEKFTLTMCNPPFYSSIDEATLVNKKKNKNLGTNLTRNFSGIKEELCYEGGEKAFLHNYLYQSSLFSDSSLWFTSLVSRKENVKSMERSSKKIGVKDFINIPMPQGNKVTRIVCWKF